MTRSIPPNPLPKTNANVGLEISEPDDPRTRNRSLGPRSRASDGEVFAVFIARELEQTGKL